MTTEYQDLVNKMFDLFSDPCPTTPEEIDTALREAGYEPDEIGARMDAVARKTLADTYETILLNKLTASAQKVKAGLTYAGSGQYQDYPKGILELGVALDAIDMMVDDILHFYGIKRTKGET